MLILSRFGGAANELSEALLVNPYERDASPPRWTQPLSCNSASDRAFLRNDGVIKKNGIVHW